MKPKTWARVPNRNLVNHALKLSDIRGWSLLSEDPVSMIAIHIPEEDRWTAALKQGLITVYNLNISVSKPQKTRYHKRQMNIEQRLQKTS